MNARLFILLLIALCGSARGQSVPRMAPPGLDEARIFALGPIGFAGVTSDEEIQFRSILALAPPEGKVRHEELYASGNPQAMSYALAGMRKLDRKRYAQLLAAGRASDATVKTMSGCIVSTEKLRRVADDVDSGKYDQWLR